MDLVAYYCYEKAMSNEKGFFDAPHIELVG